MKIFVVLSAVLACAMSQVLFGGYPGLGYQGLGYHGLGYTPYSAAPYAYNPYLRALPAPLPAPIAAPIAAPIITVPTSSQYHAQDELGQFTFGHSGDNQARVESKSYDGTVTGAYSYVDPNGKLINVNYLADNNGFRVVGANNLPESPVVPAVPELKGPEPVQDTAEVVAAKADFQKLFDEAKAAPEEAVVSRRKRGAVFLSAVPSVLAPAWAKSTLKYQQFEHVDANTPADTKKIELKEKEQEILTPTVAHVPIHAPTPLVYHAAAPVATYYTAPQYYGNSYVYL